MQLYPDPSQTLSGVSEEIRVCRLSCVDVLEGCLAAIAAREAEVRAWVLIDREGALARAHELDRELADGRWRGELHGIPIAIKDIVDVAGWPTAAGAAHWADRIAAADAPIVSRLRSAGAVILGKTVTTQFASFDPPVTRNPWNLERTPGGSSSGSAAAVACGMCYGAVGTQTGGSITRPASYCGIVSCKPTHGWITLRGVLPFAPSLDHPGPMARCVRDLAVLLDCMAAGDDPPALRGGALPPSHGKAPSLVAAVDAGRQQPPRLGRLRGLFQESADQASLEALEGALERLRVGGADVREMPLPETFAEVPRRHMSVMASEAAAWHEDALSAHPEQYLPKIRSVLRHGLQTTAAEYVRCRQHQAELSAEMDELLKGVDVLVCPATPGAAPDATSTGDPLFNAPWSYTGLPTVSLPASLSPEGLPLGIQLVGRRGGEAALLQTAAWCESRLRGR